jgi:hypothetical protein
MTRCNAVARVRALAACVGVTLAAHSAAHEGHDHDTPAPAAAPAGGPRFTAGTETFELVGALEGRRLVLWLDRADSNAPVVGATIELDLGGRALVAKPDGDVYVAELDAPPAPGTVPVAATVVAGADADVLAAELRIEPPAPAAAGPAAAARWPRGLGSADTLRLAAVGTGAALVAGLLGWAAGRRRRATAGE